MRIIDLKNQIVVVDGDTDQVALIEGLTMHSLRKQVAERKKNSRKQSKTIMRDIVENWPREALDWADISAKDHVRFKQ